MVMVAFINIIPKLEKIQDISQIIGVMYEQIGMINHLNNPQWLCKSCEHLFLSSIRSYAYVLWGVAVRVLAGWGRDAEPTGPNAR